MKVFPFLEPSESSQLPVIAVFAITVSKSQGQSFDHAGLYLPEAIFIPGQILFA
jgi:ATP-dependent exoDNAse (exonuclease V) alpha subunit